MQLATVLKQAKKLVTPTKKEQKKINQIVREVKKKINFVIKKEGYAAKLLVGGSVAKGTWLPNISDIDFFLIFDYSKYADKSAELSFYTKKILEKVWTKINCLKGSRDYFSTTFDKYNLEFIPVLDISGGKQAKNITDYSPLHIAYVQKAKCKTDIRLAKQFMKAVKVYGAESYIGGFSGHLADLLVIYYGSFLNLINAAANWPAKVILDPAKHYQNENEILQKLSKEKTIGPLILVDPIEKDRNAAAALTFEKFDKFRKAAREFLKNPSLNFFKIPKFSIKNVKKTCAGNKIIIFSCKTPKGKKDVVGAQMKKIFENLKKEFLSHDFEIITCDWEFDFTKHITYFWFCFPNKPLSKKKVLFGPPLHVSKEHINKFKQKWKNVKIEKERLVAEIKRKYLKPEQLAKNLFKKFGVKII
ncbi:MAG: CCA tRNA nucleotidyltransferase [Candidatus Nanoarchaeia archaeon]